MSIIRLISGAVMALMVAGCNDVTPPTTATSAARPGVAANPQPGSARVDPIIANQLFQSVCANNAPRFGNAAAALNGDYVRSSKTGTFFHKRINLSFKITLTGSARCSMVFKSSQDVLLTLAALSLATPKPAVKAVGGGYFVAALPQ